MLASYEFMINLVVYSVIAFLALNFYDILKGWVANRK